MGNGQFKETTSVDGALRSILAVLPSSWSVKIDLNQRAVTITGTSGATVRFDLVTGHPGRVPAALLAAPNGSSAGTLYLSEYISAPLRTQLARAGISYADATGWVWITSEDPMLAITAQGAAKAPKPDRATTAITRLDGRAAGRIVRTLIGIDPPIGVRDLAAQAGVSPGTVSKTLPTLTADSAIERDDNGQVTTVSRRQLLTRWIADYQVLRSNSAFAGYIDPRGVDNVLTKLSDMTCVPITGMRAAQAWLPSEVAPLVPITQLAVYTNDLISLAVSLGLVPVELSVANVILIVPQDLSILDAAETRDGISAAPLPLVLADLLTLPGRYPQQAEALMDALAAVDPLWSL